MSRPDPSRRYCDYTQYRACQKCGRTWAKMIGKLPGVPPGHCTCGGVLVSEDTPLLATCANLQKALTHATSELNALKKVVMR